MGDKQLSTSDIIILAAGAVMLVASFLTFYEVSVGGFSASSTAWGGDTGLKFWPLNWWPVLFGVLMAVHVALTKFANVNLPERVLDFTWAHIHFLLAAVSALLMISFLLQKFPSESPDKGIGFWLMLLASIALVVGAVMRLQEKPTGAGPSAPPTSF